MLNPDFKEFIESLNDNQVRYLVVGGYAVALHGYPRYTKDLEIWIEMTPENASKMVMALEQFGFASLGLKEDDFQVEDQIIFYLSDDQFRYDRIYISAFMLNR